MTRQMTQRSRPEGAGRGRTAQRTLAVLFGAVVTLGIAGVAWAVWTIPGAGEASASTGTLWAPGNVVANAPVNSATVAVTWDAATLATGQPATSHFVNRVRDSDGEVSAACGTSAASPTTALSCDDLGVPDGGYHYTVTAMFGNWSAQSADSPSVTVINDNSLPTVTVSSISPTPNGNGWNSSTPVAVNLSASAGFGIASITYAVDGGTPVTVMTDTAQVLVEGDGIHSVTFSARDNPGNVSETQSVVVRIDLAAPDAPSAPVLVTASDSGSSTTDGITKVTAPTFTGTAESGSTVALFDGVTPVGSGVAAGGTYTITASTRPAGTHAFTTRATDLAANTGPASTATTVVIDTTAPPVQAAPVLDPASDTGISSSDRVTNDTTPTFTGSAEIGSTVTLYSATTAIGTAQATGGSYTVTSIVLIAGTKSVTTTATDAAGNISASSPAVSVVIDLTAPSAPGTPDLIATSDSGRSATDNNTSDNTPTINGTVTAGSTVTLYSTIGTNPATLLGTVYAPSTAWSITPGALADATHAITARATDAAGNISSSSTAISLVVDTTAPPATSTPVLASGMDTGRLTTDKITNKTTPTVSGTNDSKAIVALFEAGTQLGTVTTTTTTYAVIPSLLAAGSHTVSTIPTDVAGNVGPSSATLTFTIDNTAPAAPSIPTMTLASDTGISSTDRITRSTAPIFAGTAEPNAYVRLFNGATATGTSPGSTTTGAGTYSGATSTLATGTYSITAQATDVAGNLSVFSEATAIVVDLVLPTATINQAPDQVDPTTTSPIAYTAAFSEPIYGFTGSDLTYSGTALANTAAVNGTGPYDISVSGMVKSGTVTALLTTAKVTDAAGNNNAAATSTDATVTYSDVVAPSSPSTPVVTAATDTGFSSSDAITNNTKPAFTGTAEVGSTVRIYNGATVIATSAVVPVSGLYSATTVTALTSNTYAITATATDQSLNASAASAPLSMIIDTIAPTVTLNQAAGQVDPTTGTSIDYTVTFSSPVYAFTGSTLTLTGTAGATAFAISGSGPYNVAVSGMTKSGTVIPALASGAAKDMAGNLSSTATYTDRTVTYTDNIAPEVSITGFGADPGQTATVSGVASYGLGDNLTLTVVLCTTNVFPCSAPNTRATLTGVVVNAATGAWSVTSAVLGTTGTLYARATQTDQTGNIANSVIAGPIEIP